MRYAPSVAIAYADSEGVSIAYDVVGATGPDMILVPPIGSRAVASSFPIFRRYYEGLARIARLVVYDRRGMGMSGASPEPPTLAQHVADLDAVRRAIGADRVLLTTAHVGSFLLLEYCLAHPEQVAGLILVNGFACDARDPGGDLGAPPILPWEAIDQLTGENFETLVRGFIARGLPGMDDASREQHVRYYQSSLNPQAFREQFRFARHVDLRDRLAGISVPTLVLYSSREPVCAAHGRFLQCHIPGAIGAEIDTAAEFPWAEPDSLTAVLRRYEEFVSGRVAETAERTFAALLVTDIVESTSQQRQRGDAAWKLLREAFETTSQSRVEQLGGRILQFLGDGVLATFPLPSAALHAALRLRTAARELGIEIRSGVHAGEAEVHDDGLSGISVNIAVRTAAAAGGDEVLVTSTAREIVEGAGFRFGPERAVELKGVGERRLFPLVQ